MREGGLRLAALAVLAASAWVLADATPSIPISGAAAASAPDAAPLSEVAVTAPEPRYVAPTLRDRLGRIWAPVYLNGKGPYRLVLDTGASHSAIIASVAAELGLPPNGAVMLRGATGSAIVPF